MGLNNTQEFIIALLGALGAREILAYLIKRWRYRTEISAQARKIGVETKSLEVGILSGLVERLDVKVQNLEKSLSEALAREEICMKNNRELLSRVAALERENQHYKFSPANKEVSG